MPAVDVIKNIGQGLMALGVRRLIALGMAGLVVFLLVGISGYLLGVNPFDQPGVEAYKKNMFALLDKPGYEEESKAIKARL